MDISIVNSLPEDAWRQFVDANPDGNIFHTPEMYQVYSQTKRYRPQVWAAMSDDQILALFLPVQITLVEGILHNFTTRAVVYGSPLCEPGPRGKEALNLLLRAYTHNVKGKPIFTEIRNLVDLTDIQSILCECGFVFEEHLNYLIDLDCSEDAIWSNLSKKTRQHIHKSRESGLTIDDMVETKELGIAYRVLEQVYSRISVPLADISLFKAAFNILHPRGMMKAFLVRKEQNCIGFNAFLLYKDRIYDWFRGSKREYSAFQPESLLLWGILQWGREHKYHTFDFGGAGKPSEPYGPRVFKSRWGGTLVNFGRNTFTHSPDRMTISRIGYKLGRFLFRNHL